MTDYSWVTTEMFDEKLQELCRGADLLLIPGVYELAQEFFNNEVLAALENEREDVRRVSQSVTLESVAEALGYADAGAEEDEDE